MRSNWLWDRKITNTEAKRILKDPSHQRFVFLAALLLTRTNEPKEVFGNYIDPRIFCQHWNAIKKQMRKDSWSQPRIIFWQAIYEKLVQRYRKQGVVFRNTRAKLADPLFKNVGKEIAEVRRTLGLSQKQLAEKVGVSQQVISRIESGSNISLRTLKVISQALDKECIISFT